MIFENLIKENKGAILFTILVMLIGSITYLSTDQNQMSAEKNDQSTFQSIKFKVIFGPDGAMNLLATTKNNAMATLNSEEGNSIPEEDSVVLGSQVAARLKNAGIFSESGDIISSYFGISTTVEGILEKQNSIVDYISFLSATEFEKISGDADKVFSKITMDGSLKIFFKLLTNETLPQKFKLAEGSISGYELHDLDGEEYYPLILGAKEAEMMREEKLFTSTGDPIRDFFGKNFVVVGVLEETNTIVDYLYFVPLNDDEITEESEELVEETKW